MEAARELLAGLHHAYADAWPGFTESLPTKDVERAATALDTFASAVRAAASREGRAAGLEEAAKVCRQKADHAKARQETWRNAKDAREVIEVGHEAGALACENAIRAAALAGAAHAQGGHDA